MAKKAAKNLVIVESPAKAKTIGKYLGRGYTVTASMGHIRDLPASTLGIDVENGYTPKYITIKGKQTLLRTSLALIVGGGIGNMFDRVLLGYVVDFIDVRIFGSLWRWVFNVADAAVCVGAALLVIYCLVSYKKEKKETAK